VQTLTGSENVLAAFFARPTAAALGVACILIWLIPLVQWARGRKENPRQEYGT
jgi:hypothetical protein